VFRFRLCHTFFPDFVWAWIYPPLVVPRGVCPVSPPPPLRPAAGLPPPSLPRAPETCCRAARRPNPYFQLLETVADDKSPVRWPSFPAHGPGPGGGREGRRGGGVACPLIARHGLHAAVEGSIKAPWRGGGSVQQLAESASWLFFFWTVSLVVVFKCHTRLFRTPRSSSEPST